MTNKIALSPLKRWLRKNNLNMLDLATMLGCHRHTVRSISDGKPVEESIALKMYFISDGAIDPEVKRRGRPSCEQAHTAQIC